MARQSTNHPGVGLEWLQKLRELGGEFKQAHIEPTRKRRNRYEWPPLIIPAPRPVSKGYAKTKFGNIIKIPLTA